MTIDDILKASRVDKELAAQLEKMATDHVQAVKCIDEIYRDRREEAERHTDELQRLKNNMQLVRGNCPHLTTTFHPDASGNNGSYTTCDVCEKEL